MALTHYWRLDEPQGATRVDSVGSLDLTDAGAPFNYAVTRQTGPTATITEAAGFVSPTFDYLTAATPLAYPSSNRFTVNLWVRWDTATGAGAVVGNNLNAAGAFNLGWSLVFTRTSTGLYRATVVYTTVDFELQNLRYYELVGGYIIPDRQWHMYTIIWNQYVALNAFSLYIDGQFSTTGIPPSSRPVQVPTTTTPFTVGAATHLGGFYGGIAAVGYWDQVLTPAVIQSLFTSGAYADASNIFGVGTMSDYVSGAATVHDGNQQIAGIGTPSTYASGTAVVTGSALTLVNGIGTPSSYVSGTATVNGGNLTIHGIGTPSAYASGTAAVGQTVITGIIPLFRSLDYTLDGSVVTLLDPPVVNSTQQFRADYAVVLPGGQHQHVTQGKNTWDGGATWTLTQVPLDNTLQVFAQEASAVPPPTYGNLWYTYGRGPGHDGQWLVLTKLDGLHGDPPTDNPQTSPIAVPGGFIVQQLHSTSLRYVYLLLLDQTSGMNQYHLYRYDADNGGFADLLSSNSYYKAPGLVSITGFFVVNDDQIFFGGDSPLTFVGPGGFNYHYGALWYTLDGGGTWLRSDFANSPDYPPQIGFSLNNPPGQIKVAVAGQGFRVYVNYPTGPEYTKPSNGPYPTLYYSDNLGATWQAVAESAGWTVHGTTFVQQVGGPINLAPPARNTGHVFFNGGPTDQDNPTVNTWIGRIVPDDYFVLHPLLGGGNSNGAGTDVGFYLDLEQRLVINQRGTVVWGSTDGGSTWAQRRSPPDDTGAPGQGEVVTVDPANDWLVFCYRGASKSSYFFNSNYGLNTWWQFSTFGAMTQVAWVGGQETLPV